MYVLWLLTSFEKNKISFLGGYITGSKELIDYIRSTSSGMMYSNAMSPVICKQILRALQVIMGMDGTDTGITNIFL